MFWLANIILLQSQTKTQLTLFLYYCDGPARVWHRNSNQIFYSKFAARIALRFLSMLANDTNSSYHHQAATTPPHLYWSLQTSLGILLDTLLTIFASNARCGHQICRVVLMTGLCEGQAVPSSAAWSCCCWLLLLPSDSLLLSRLARSPFIQRVFMLLYRGCSLICGCVPRMEIRDQAVWKYNSSILSPGSVV